MPAIGIFIVCVCMWYALKFWFFILPNVRRERGLKMIIREQQKEIDKLQEQISDLKAKQTSTQGNTVCHSSAL